MSISSSDTDSDNDIEDDIICVAISKQIRREQWLLSQRPQHTSRPGMAWDCVGAIDGTYIQGEVPRNKQLAYHNRKGNASQNVLCACDFDMRFTFIAAGWEGKDSKVLESAIADPMTNFPFSPNEKYYVVDAGLRNAKGF
uniref:DDE Tnp4 domain-containing protein n=1 Tax=Nicotiana tabacum TaxID=4097 RepID=A0A1S3Y495_TOBAC|nr:PREDICTED: uncharacterized protein LOC107772009 [Nicotiana tabacum]